jgi:hypothetical protein
MSTAPAPTGALSRRGTHAPTGPQTKPLHTMRRLAGRAPSLTGAAWLAVSPDGTTVYDAPFNGGAGAVFNPAPAGHLTTAGCLFDDGSGGACADLPGHATDRRHPLASIARTPPTPTA